MTQTPGQLNQRVHQRGEELRTPTFLRLPVTGLIRSPAPHAWGIGHVRAPAEDVAAAPTPCRPLRFLKRLPMGSAVPGHSPVLTDEGMRRRTTLQGITVHGHGVHTFIEDHRHWGT